MEDLLTNDDMPSVELKEPIYIQDALSDKGLEFEVNFSNLPDQEPDPINSDEFIDLCNFDCLGIQDEDSYDDSTPFESIAAKMVNLLPGGEIKKRIMRAGYGEVVPKSSLVYIHYSAYIEYNEEPFDSTRVRKRMQKFRLCQHEVIPGLDLAVQSMKMNEKSQFLIIAEYAYGKIGCLDRVPPESTILFEVELVNFVDSAAAEAADPDKLTDFDDIRKYALALCDMGNDLIKTNMNYKMAIKQYNMAVNKLEFCTVTDYDEQEQMNKLLLRLYTNLAVSYVKIEDPRKCCINCNKIYQLCRGTELMIPAKVYYNNAKALVLLNDLPMAEKRLRMAAERDRDNPHIVRLFLTINDLKEKQHEQEKKFAKILVGQRDTVSEAFKHYINELCEDLKGNENIFQSPVPQKLNVHEIDHVKETVEKFGMEFKTVKIENVDRHMIIKQKTNY